MHSFNLVYFFIQDKISFIFLWTEDQDTYMAEVNSIKINRTAYL
jgi:hypothetical protein